VRVREEFYQPEPPALRQPAMDVSNRTTCPRAMFSVPWAIFLIEEAERCGSLGAVLGYHSVFSPSITEAIRSDALI
jgi:hypothetical protein